MVNFPLGGFGQQRDWGFPTPVTRFNICIKLCINLVLYRDGSQDLPEIGVDVPEYVKKISCISGRVMVWEHCWIGQGNLSWATVLDRLLSVYYFGKGISFLFFLFYSDFVVFLLFSRTLFNYFGLNVIFLVLYLFSNHLSLLWWLPFSC